MTPSQRRMRDIAAMIGAQLKRNETMPLQHPFHITFTHDGWALIRRALNKSVQARASRTKGD